MFWYHFLLGCAFADHVYHHFRKFKNCVLMFSRLSREFGVPFFCVWVLILFFGILFILWVLLSGDCRTISTLSGCLCFGLIECSGFGGF